MAHTHRLDQYHHRKFLAEERSDPVTKEKFKHGDEIVFCSACKSAFLADSWQNFFRGRHCEQQNTLSTFSSDLEAIGESFSRKRREKKLLEFPKYTQSVNAFNCFTSKAMDAVIHAKQEAIDAGHNFLGTEQLLLGLVAKKSGKASQILASAGLTLNRVRIEIMEIEGERLCFSPEDCWFTPKAFRILEDSLEEMTALGCSLVESEHLLLSMIKSKNNVGTIILQELNVNTNRLKSQIYHQSSIYTTH